MLWVPCGLNLDVDIIRKILMSTLQVSIDVMSGRTEKLFGFGGRLTDWYLRSITGIVLPEG